MDLSWLESLNPAQRAAVTHGDGPLLVIAGAGTGKTRTLACRVAWLIDQGVPAERILLLTFTRRAAAEMVSRATNLAGQSVARVWGGTFHSVANRLLRIHGSALGLPPEFTVMDEADSAGLMGMLLSELETAAKGDRRFPRKETLLRIYSRMVNSGDKLSEVCARHFPWCSDYMDAMRPVFEQYIVRKRTNQVLDYDDLLLYWKALCGVPELGDMLSERFDHILVDEYQDTNRIQADILRAMRTRIPNIMAVGDDAQSIYSFRAAEVRNMLDFPRHFPGTRTVTLEENYRSLQPILDASNAVMIQAAERFTKNLRTTRGDGEKPVLVTCQSEAEQDELVCQRILEHLSASIPLHRQAVLFRAGSHSNSLEIELARRKIPFHKYGGLRFIEAAHIKDMLAFLRVLENPWDELSWFRILTMLEGVGPKAARRVMEAIGVLKPRENTSAAWTPPAPGEILDEPVEEPAPQPLPGVSPLRSLFAQPPAVPRAAVKRFAELRVALADCLGVPIARDGGAAGTAYTAVAAPALPVQVERIRDYYQPLFEQRYENAKARLGDIEQLEQIAAGYRSRSRFIVDLTLDPPSSTADLAGAPYLEEDFLILSTIHSAKGCEWDVVHILHVTDGCIPSDMATRDDRDIDEERRLLYVAMTRARDQLYLYSPLNYYHRKSRHSPDYAMAQLSRFITPAVREQLRFQQSTTPRHDFDGPLNHRPAKSSFQPDGYIARLMGDTPED